MPTALKTFAERTRLRETPCDNAKARYRKTGATSSERLCTLSMMRLRLRLLDSSPAASKEDDGVQASSGCKWLPVMSHGDCMRWAIETCDRNGTRTDTDTPNRTNFWSRPVASQACQ
jgi:hypothetical protein